MIAVIKLIYSFRLFSRIIVHVGSFLFEQNQRRLPKITIKEVWDDWKKNFNIQYPTRHFSPLQLDEFRMTKFYTRGISIIWTHTRSAALNHCNQILIYSFKEISTTASGYEILPDTSTTTTGNIMSKLNQSYLYQPFAYKSLSHSYFHSVLM